MTRRLFRPMSFAVLLAALGPACSTVLGIGPLPGSDGGEDGGGAQVDAPANAADVVTPGDATVDGPAPDSPTASEASSLADGACPYQDSTDHDGDGFSYAQGDCNDCNPNINPGAYDFPDGIDQDCDGTADDEPTLCDTTVALASSDPLDAAKTLGLCRQTTDSAQGPQRTWGIVSATYVGADGSDGCATIPVPDAGGGTSCAANPNFPLGHGNLSKLGVNVPREGARMLGLSSGTARDPTDPGYEDVSGFDKMYTCPFPTGYPVTIPSCPGVITGQGHDCSALKLVIRVPTNVSSFQFTENFFTYEFPQYVCSEYNDYFVALMSPSPDVTNGNVVFDGLGNPINVDTNLLQVCDPQMAGGQTYTCPLGSASLSGTGFGISGTSTTNHAATGWLTTTVPVDVDKGKDITLVLGVWDSSDGILDSTVLVDAFTWSASPVSGVSTVASTTQ